MTARQLGARARSRCHRQLRTRLGLVAVLVAAAVLMPAGPASAAGGRITTFKDRAHHVRFPLGITAGPDGNLWFTNTDNNRIGRIDSGAQPRT